jgi:hypothetical protein
VQANILTLASETAAKAADAYLNLAATTATAAGGANVGDSLGNSFPHGQKDDAGAITASEQPLKTTKPDQALSPELVAYRAEAASSVLAGLPAVMSLFGQAADALSRSVTARGATAEACQAAAGLRKGDSASATSHQLGRQMACTEGGTSVISLHLTPPDADERAELEQQVAAQQAAEAQALQERGLALANAAKEAAFNVWLALEVALGSSLPDTQPAFMPSLPAPTSQPSLPTSPVNDPALSPPTLTKAAGEADNQQSGSKYVDEEEEEERRMYAAGSARCTRTPAGEGDPEGRHNTPSPVGDQHQHQGAAFFNSPLAEARQQGAGGHNPDALLFNNYTDERSHYVRGSNLQQSPGVLLPQDLSPEVAAALLAAWQQRAATAKRAAQLATELEQLARAQEDSSGRRDMGFVSRTSGQPPAEVATLKAIDDLLSGKTTSTASAVSQGRAERARAAAQQASAVHKEMRKEAMLAEGRCTGPHVSCLACPSHTLATPALGPHPS